MAGLQQPAASLEEGWGLGPHHTSVGSRYPRNAKTDRAATKMTAARRRLSARREPSASTSNLSTPRRGENRGPPNEGLWAVLGASSSANSVVLIWSSWRPNAPGIVRSPGIRSTVAVHLQFRSAQRPANAVAPPPVARQGRRARSDGPRERASQVLADGCQGLGSAAFATRRQVGISRRNRKSSEGVLSREHPWDDTDGPRRRPRRNPQAGLPDLVERGAARRARPRALGRSQGCVGHAEARAERCQRAAGRRGRRKVHSQAALEEELSRRLVPRIALPVYGMDRAITRAARLPPSSARVAFSLGWLADARVLLGGGALWLLATPGQSAARSDAVRFMTTIAATTALHHAVKRIVDQIRPDRVIGSGRLKTGRSLDAMPSGHAMHAGAVAALFSDRVARPAVLWSAALGLASARVAMLAHWPSGVALGFLGGVAVARCTRWVRRSHSRKP